MATHSSTLAWKIPWTEEPSRLPSRGCKESNMIEWHYLLTYCLKYYLSWLLSFFSAPLKNVHEVSASLASSWSWFPAQCSWHRNFMSSQVRAALTSSMQRSPAPVCGSYWPAGNSLFWKNHWKRVSFLVLVTWGRSGVRRLLQASSFKWRPSSSELSFTKMTSPLPCSHLALPLNLSQLLPHTVCLLWWLLDSGLLLMTFPLLLDPFPTLFFSVNSCVTSSRKPSFLRPRVPPIMNSKFHACLHHNTRHAVCTGSCFGLWDAGGLRRPPLRSCRPRACRVLKFAEWMPFWECAVP